MNQTIDGSDLTIGNQRQRYSAGGSWVSGTLHGHRFQALVFSEHAEVGEYELGSSRISKLWLQRMADGTVVYNWDRGLDQPPIDATTAAIVELLAARLAALIYDGVGSDKIG